MRGLGHGVQARFHDRSAAHSADTVSALVQAFERSFEFDEAGGFALADTKIQITLRHALGVRVARPGQGLSGHVHPVAVAAALLGHQTQQIGQHVLQTFPVVQAMVVGNRGSDVVHATMVAMHMTVRIDVGQKVGRLHARSGRLI
jgi:hypothetical protein